MIKNEIKEWIKENGDDRMARFAASLIPGLRHRIYGVRRPLLRQKAKELIDHIKDIENDSCEEILLKGYAIGHLKDQKQQLDEVRSFVPLIDNWEVCDTFCGGLKNALKYQDSYWTLVCGYARSSSDYEQRFAHVMMLKYFCNPVYIDSVLQVLAAAHPVIWDTKQGVAWALAECFIKFPEKTKPVLQKITPEIYKLTRRKILDSKRVDAAVKQQIKNENRADFV